MSAVAIEGRRRSSVGVVVAVAGVAGLALRPWAPLSLGVPGLPLSALFAAILFGSIAAPGVREQARMSRPLVAMLGLGGVALAAIASGNPVPAAFGIASISYTVLASIAEEACFRRVVYDELSPWGPAIAIVGSAALFAAIHLPAYGLASLPVDFGAGLLLSWQRWASGTWTLPAATHVAANLLAVIR